MAEREVIETTARLIRERRFGHSAHPAFAEQWAERLRAAVDEMIVQAANAERGRLATALRERAALFDRNTVAGDFIRADELRRVADAIDKGVEHG